MRAVLGLVLLIFLGAIGLFAVQNMQIVEVRFAIWSPRAPLAILAVAVYVLGMLSGWTVLGFLRKSLHRLAAEPRHRTE